MVSSDPNAGSVPTDVPWLEERDTITCGDKIRIIVEESGGSIRYDGIEYNWQIMGLDLDESPIEYIDESVGLVIEVGKVIRPRGSTKDSGYLFIQKVLNQFDYSKSDLPVKEDLKSSTRDESNRDKTNKKEYSPQNTDVRRRLDSKSDSNIMSDINSSKL